VRAIIPGQIPDSEVFQPSSIITRSNSLQIFSSIPEGLAGYGDSVKFILGSAVSLNSASKTVTVKTAKGEEDIGYHQLIIATGSRTNGEAPWKSLLKGSEATKKLLHETQAAVEKAKVIVVGGGGKSPHLIPPDNLNF
jgi:NADH dehydrogenase FAD-containing subunit